jgi:hypothetical protein
MTISARQGINHLILYDRKYAFGISKLRALKRFFVVLNVPGNQLDSEQQFKYILQRLTCYVRNLMLMGISCNPSQNS